MILDRWKPLNFNGNCCGLKLPCAPSTVVRPYPRSLNERCIWPDSAAMTVCEDEASEAPTLASLPNRAFGLTMPNSLLLLAQDPAFSELALRGA